MQKLAMRHEGTRRQHARKWDKCEDLELYGILKKEWKDTAIGIGPPITEQPSHTTGPTGRVSGGSAGQGRHK